MQSTRLLTALHSNLAQAGAHAADSLTEETHYGLTMFTLDRTTPPEMVLERLQYPFSVMEIGDSLHIQDFRKAESARVSAIQYIKRHQLDWKFSMKKCRDGWRIFRIR